MLKEEQQGCNQTASWNWGLNLFYKLSLSCEGIKALNFKYKGDSKIPRSGYFRIVLNRISLPTFFHLLMKIKLLGLAGMLLISSGSFAQSYIGHTVDNYSGVHGVIFNPSSVVDSNFRTDINLMSVSAFAGSDYFGINFSNAFESTEGFSIEEGVQRFPKDDNHFFLNLDVLGPSFMFNLNRKNSLAITTRIRGFMNLNNVNGELYENIGDGFEETGNFDFQQNNFSGTIHSWGEIGLTYGRIFMNGETNFLKGGVTLKYLQGAGSTFMNAPAVTGNFNAETQLLTTTGSLNYGISNDFDGGDVDFSNPSSGIGADLGLTYEYRPILDFEEDLDVVRHIDYKFKLGLSITDLGSLNYSGSTVTSYDLDNTIHIEDINDEDMEQWLKDNYDGVEQQTDSKIGLPTAMHILADYKFRKRLFVAVQGTISLVGEGKDQANRVIHTITAVPRFESKWFSLYLPVGVRQYDGFTMGTGLRLGPLSLGSSSIISNYISDSVKTTDFYIGLKIPIYR